MQIAAVSGTRLHYRAMPRFRGTFSYNANDVATMANLMGKTEQELRVGLNFLTTEFRTRTTDEFPMATMYVGGDQKDQVVCMIQEEPQKTANTLTFREAPHSTESPLQFQNRVLNTAFPAGTP